MKIEDNVPIITPSIIANEKLRMLSPPRKKMQSRTNSVDNDVFIVLVSVSLSESLKIVKKSLFLYNPRFSRIRSNTTTLSLIE